MTIRLFKQILVGFCTLTFLSLCGFWFYSGVLKPGPTCFDNKLNQQEEEIDCGGTCHSCEINHLIPLEFSSNAEYLLQNGKYFLYARVLNTNQSYGAKNFKYSFLATLANGQTKKIEGTDYVLPSAGKYVLLTNIPLDLKPTNVTFSIDPDSIEWSAPISPNIPKNVLRISNVNLKRGNNLNTATSITQNTIYYNFTQNLKQGSKGEEVRNLQAILTADSDVMTIVPKLIISGVYDLNTTKAVIIWQKNHDIKPQTGTVGSLTRDKLNELYGRPSNDPSVHQGSYDFSIDLKINMTNSQVNDLQRALASDPSIYPEGQITGKFGALTKKAVERFQIKYGLKATGIVDSATRAVLNNVFNKPKATNTDTISGVNVFIEGTAFNQAPITWRAATIIGFICDANTNVVGISKTILNNVVANSQQKFYLSWNNNLPVDLKVCPDGLTIDTNTMDAANWVK